MNLNEAVDPPSDRGVPRYRRIFLDPAFVATLPSSQLPIIRKLESAIGELVCFFEASSFARREVPLIVSRSCLVSSRKTGCHPRSLPQTPRTAVSSRDATFPRDSRAM